MKMNTEQLQAMLTIGEIAFDAGIEKTMEMEDLTRVVVETALEMYKDFQEIIEFQKLLKR